LHQVGISNYFIWSLIVQQMMYTSKGGMSLNTTHHLDSPTALCSSLTTKHSVLII